MIRFAQPRDRAQLMVMWQEAFGDSDADTAWYFDHRHKDENLLLYEQDGVIAGMLTLLPATLQSGGRNLPVRYVYAVATLKAYRRQGISTQLLDQAHAWMRKAGMAASVLAPATPELFDFYAKRGYQTSFYADQVTVQAPMIAQTQEEARVADADAATYARVRDKAMAGSRLYIQWDAEALSYVLDSERASGSRVLHVQSGHGEAVAICQLQAVGQVRIVEMLTIGIGSAQGLSLLHPHLKADTYLLRLPQGAWPGSKPTRLGMILPFTHLPDGAGAPPYLGLIKD